MKNNKLFLAAGCIFALAGQQASADSADVGMYHVYISAMFGKPDSSRPVVQNSGTGYAGGVGIPLYKDTNRWHVELAGNSQRLQTPKSTSSSFFRQELASSLMYSFGDRDELTPFVLGGLGVAHNDVIPDSDDEYTFTAHLGAGLTKLFANTVRGRVEVRGMYDDYQDGYFDAALLAGVELPIGRRKTIEVVKVVTPPPVIVEKQVEVIKEVERLQEVAPPDSDGDRIEDKFDKCPGTLSGVRSDNDGCALPDQAIVLRNIEFDFGKDTLTPASMPLIDAAAVFLSNQKNLRAIIAGHTDSVGSDRFNLDLSKRRANTVRKVLIEKGVSEKRLNNTGFGESMPVASNTTDEGRQLNRRVEFLLLAAAAE